MTNKTLHPQTVKKNKMQTNRAILNYMDKHRGLIINKAKQFDDVHKPIFELILIQKLRKATDLSSTIYINYAQFETQYQIAHEPKIYQENNLIEAENNYNNAEEVIDHDPLEVELLFQKCKALGMSKTYYNELVQWYKTGLKPTHMTYIKKWIKENLK